MTELKNQTTYRNDLERKNLARRIVMLIRSECANIMNPIGCNRVSESVSILLAEYERWIINREFSRIKNDAKAQSSETPSE